MTTTRRRFLAAAASTVAAPMFVPSTALGRDGAVAASERITMACIGVGGMGTGNLQAFLADPRVQMLAICDVDANHRNRGLDIAKLKPADGTGDFRQIIDRKDIDAVMIATPDHWHALITVAAARAGKDVYCEKPLASSIGESRFVRDTIVKTGRVLQCGTWRRSRRGCRFACELVRNGRIGTLKEVRVGVPGTFAVSDGFTGLEEPQPVPDHFDYAMWLGPSPKAPYTPGRCHFNFRWVLDYAPGYITDWGAHYLDVAQWGIGADDSGPVQIVAESVRRRDKGYYDAPESFRITYTYANGVKAIMTATDDKDQWGMKFIGDKGWVYVESNSVVTEPEDLRRAEIGPNEIHLYESKDHHGNFLDAVKSRGQTAAPIEVAHRSATTCHLGTIAALTGRPIKWDPKAEKIVGDADAEKMIVKPMAEPWTLQ